MHAERRVSPPDTQPSSVLPRSELARSAVSVLVFLSSLPGPGQRAACLSRSRAGRRGCSASRAPSPLCSSRCGRGAPVSRCRGLALGVLTKEAGGSTRGFPLPGENSLLPYIYKYIRGTDKSSLFRKKPGRPTGSAWPWRTRLEGREAGRRGPRGSGVTLQIPTKDNET